MKYRFMNEHRHLYSLVLMCRVLPVARAGDFMIGCINRYQIARWRINDSSDLFAISMLPAAVYGSNRVFGDLRQADETCGRHRVARLMRVNQIKAIRGYKAPRQIAGRPSLLPILAENAWLIFRE